MSTPSKETWFEWFKRDLENGRVLHKQMVRYARTLMSQDPSSAEDVVQDFYCVFPERARGYDYDINLNVPLSQDRKARAYVFASLNRHIIDCQRKNKRKRTLSLVREPYEEDVEDRNVLNSPCRLELEEASLLFGKVLEKLPEKLSLPIILVYYQGLKCKEAAWVLKIPVGTLKSRLHKGNLKLRLEESLKDAA